MNCFDSLHGRCYCLLAVAGYIGAVSLGQDETIIGSCRYIAGDAPGGKRHAEVAFIVEEDYHGLGIASRILRHLTAIARNKGISAFEADVLPENKAMLAVFARCGLAMSQSREDGVVHVTFQL